jgi:hypothetical protein
MPYKTEYNKVYKRHRLVYYPNVRRVRDPAYFDGDIILLGGRRCHVTKGWREPPKKTN